MLYYCKTLCKTLDLKKSSRNDLLNQKLSYSLNFTQNALSRKKLNHGDVRTVMADCFLELLDLCSVTLNLLALKQVKNTNPFNLETKTILNNFWNGNEIPPL